MLESLHSFQKADFDQKEREIKIGDMLRSPELRLVFQGLEGRKGIVKKRQRDRQIHTKVH